MMAKRGCRLFLFGLVLPLVAAAKGVYLSVPAFVEQAFPVTPEAKVLWLQPEQKEQAAHILGHPLQSLRLRYWLQGERSAWVFEEIGKELPITIGVVVEQARVKQLSILAYRESRGGEVRYPFFTDQFVEAQLQPDLQLDRTIDGITGATLSVSAVTRVARLALYMASQVSGNGVSGNPSVHE